MYVVIENQLKSLSSLTIQTSSEKKSDPTPEMSSHEVLKAF